MPRTRVAASWFAIGALNLNKREFPVSATHRLPEESKAICRGWAREVAFIDPLKGAPPRSKLAVSPLEKGALNSTIQLFLDASATHKLPEESNARPSGSHVSLRLPVPR